MSQIKIIKYIQIVFSIAIDLAFLFFLIFHPSLKYSVYSDPNLFVLCALMWVICIGTLFFLVLDLFLLVRLELNQHELNKEIYLDELTGIPNRHGLDIVFDSYEEPSKFPHVGCAIITIENLDELNSSKGHSYGDKAIRDFCEIFERIGDKYGFVARNGGNEYLAILEDCTESKMDDFINDLGESITVRNQTTTDPAIVLSSAYVLSNECDADSMSDLISAAYRKLELHA